jgi:hypothetical protein
MTQAEPDNTLPRGVSAPYETVAEQARRRGIQPVTSVEAMAGVDGFDSDGEVDEFLAHVYAERHANLT